MVSAAAVVGSVVVAEVAVVVVGTLVVDVAAVVEVAAEDLVVAVVGALVSRARRSPSKVTAAHKRPYSGLRSDTLGFKRALLP